MIIPNDTINYTVGPCALNRLKGFHTSKIVFPLHPVGSNPQPVTEKTPRRRSCGGVFGHSLVQRCGRGLGTSCWLQEIQYNPPPKMEINWMNEHGGANGTKENILYKHTQTTESHWLRAVEFQ